MNSMKHDAARRPLITVLMSVYNGDKWLEESIRSVLAQTISYFEFVIVNDGSNDGSLQIIKHFARQDARVRLVDKPNTGLADSLNCGLRIANGEWIARLDADDVCMPERLRTFQDFVRSRVELVLVGSSFIEIDGRGICASEQKYPSSHTKLLNNLERHKRFFPHSSAFYRTDVARELHGYNVRVERSQDHDFWLRLAEKGRLACIDKPLVKIRQHANQISNEESGFRQLYYDYASTICHFLRKSQVADPSSDLDMVQWFTFLDWVKTEVGSRADLLNRLKLQHESRIRFRSGELWVIRRMKQMQIMANSGLLYRMLWARYWGTSLPYRLADKWQSLKIKQGADCA